MMETEPPLSAIPRMMLRPEDAVRLARPFRHDDHDRPRAASENRMIPGQQDLASILDTSPPRIEEQIARKNSRTDITSLSLEDTTELFRQKIADAQQETEHALAGSEEITSVVKPKLTLDLGYANIARLPESVVDLIKAEVERLSLSHNQIWHIPLRFAECTHLRYLNIRANVFREIPKGVYKLPLLEILDISRNKIRRISKDIRNLTALRVFSVVHNRIDDLPSELCEMSKLQILKIAENPLRPKLKKLIEAKEAEVTFSELNDNERETALTVEIKRFLREIHPVMTPIDTEAASEHGESPMETPKPSRKVTRFPVIPSTGVTDTGSEGNKSSSPNDDSVPPIPVRSHHRMASGQGLGIRRPGVAPLISSSERNRSNSESILQASAAARNKRMGMVRNKPELDSIEETKANRNSHLRGLSHGSVLRRNGNIPSPGVSGSSSSPSSPREARRNRFAFVKRLSSLPEHKVETEWHNPMIEGAKGILYALYQIHPQISGLIAAIKGKDIRRSSLEFTFYNASTHVDRLNEALEHADSVDPADEEAFEKAEETVQRDCATCIMAYSHVSVQLQDNVRKIVSGTDARYVRTLMLLLYGSILEIRNAIASFGMDVHVTKSGHRRQMSSGNTHPIQTIPEEFTTPQKFVRPPTPTRDRAAPSARLGARIRSDTTIQHPVPPLPQSILPLAGSTISNLNSSAMNGPHSSTASSFTNGSSLNSANSFGFRSRSNSRNPGNISATNSSFSSVASTPRSVEGFNLPPAQTYTLRVNPVTGMTDSQEESVFEQIFLALTRAYDAALQAIPITKAQFIRCLEAAEENRQPKAVHDLWSMLIYRCKTCQDVSEALQTRLLNMRIRDPTMSNAYSGSGRDDPQFWLLCKKFLQSFIDLVTDMREAKGLRLLPQELITILRPVQKTSREAGRLIDNSPWRRLMDGNNNLPPPALYGSNSNHSSSTVNGNSYTNGYSGLNGLSNYPHVLPQTHLHHFQSPFPPPAIPIPPIPTTSNYTSNSSAPAVQPASTSYNNGGGNNTSPISVPLPATPLSAALGPAAQATVPNTPASAYGDSFFKGDVFQRADSLLNMPQAGAMNFLGGIRR